MQMGMRVGPDGREHDAPSDAGGHQVVVSIFESDAVKGLAGKARWPLLRSGSGQQTQGAARGLDHGPSGWSNRADRPNARPAFRAGDTLIDGGNSLLQG